MTNKPVVILAGWLGCQPRNLRRYHDMYEKLGLTSVIRIGSPQSLLNAMTMGPQSSSEKSSSLTISLLTEIQSLQPPYFVIHIFSNNGCFLWEWIRYLLFESSSLDLTTVDTHNLRRKLIGVVFDSAPVYYDGKIDGLQSALQYIPKKEKDHILQVAYTIDTHLLKQRFHEFWNGLCNDTIHIPQLYMYSTSDELASATEIERLIQYRKRSNIVWKHNFTDSEHCGHILKYPELYHEKVEQFLDFCTTNGIRGEVSQQSRL